MTDLPEPDALLAAELALSLLEGDERLAAERRLLTDPAFRDAVASWQEGLVGLADAVDDVPVRRQVKTQLMARLFPAPHRRLWPWPLFGASATAAVLALVVAWPLLQPPNPTLPGPLVPAPAAQDLAVFDVAAPDGSLIVLATLDHVTRTLYFARTAGAAPTGRALELWAIQGGNPPVSLGLLPDQSSGNVQIPAGIGAEGLVLAISDEPAGGSPSGAPTGAILATGQVTEL